MSAPRDRIAVRGIRVFGRHGALEGERDRPQPFDLDFELELDLTAARASDELADTLDYAAVHARIVGIVQERSYALLERLGDEIVRALLADPRVLAAGVTIGKPALLAGATPSVTVRAARASTGSASGSAAGSVASAGSASGSVASAGSASGSVASVASAGSTGSAAGSVGTAST